MDDFTMLTIMGESVEREPLLRPPVSPLLTPMFIIIGVLAFWLSVFREVGLGRGLLLGFTGIILIMFGSFNGLFWLVSWGLG